MTLLHTQYASGNLFTVGPTGAQIGVSGINEITNRINTHTHDGADTPGLTGLMNFGSGIQNPLTYIIGSSIFLNISGTAITVDARGKPYSCNYTGMITQNTAGLGKRRWRIHRSGTTAGEANSIEIEHKNDNGTFDDFTPVSMNWIDIPTSGINQVVYSAQIKATTAQASGTLVQSTLYINELT